MDRRWIGWKDGKPVRIFPNRYAGDRALDRREVDSTSPALHYRGDVDALAASLSAGAQ